MCFCFFYQRSKTVIIGDKVVSLSIVSELGLQMHARFNKYECVLFNK